MQYYEITLDKDSLQEIRKIAEAIRGCHDVAIHFTGTEYHWTDPDAVADFNRLMCGTLNYDTHWGRPDLPFNKGIVFENVNGLHISGSNTTLLLAGLIAPFTFRNCSNVHMENIAIRWERPPFTPFHIVKVEGKRIFLNIFDGFQIFGGEPIWAIMEYDTVRNRIGAPWKFRVNDVLHLESDDTIWFETDTCDGNLQAGNNLIVRHIGNYRPIIHLYGGRNFRFSNMTLYSGPGMGLVAHLTEDVTLRNFNVRPWKNLMMSTNTDATHFISCAGTIDVEDCYFEGMGDDAINVHGFYNTITAIPDSCTAEVTICNPNGTQDMIFDAPAAGDCVEFSHHDILLPFASGKVRDVNIDEAKWSATLHFDGPIPDQVQPGDLLTDCSRVAAMRFVRCHINSIRARAALIQTRNALIENCLIENCTGTGIHVDTATGWYEAIGTRDVVIRNNIIRNCGYGDATYCQTAGIAVTTECPENALGVHKRLEIVGNDIECGGKNGIFVSCCKEVSICSNKIKNCPSAILFECSDQLCVRDNEIDGDIRMQHQSYGFQELGI